jgi:DNA-binding GntR family transcriptional regulator
MDDSNPVQRMYLHAAASLRDEIESGLRPPASKLPPIGALCAMKGISRQTAGKAMRVLEKEGLAYREPGLGWFVAVPPQARDT